MKTFNEWKKDRDMAESIDQHLVGSHDDGGVFGDQEFYAQPVRERDGRGASRDVYHIYDGQKFDGQGPMLVSKAKTREEAMATIARLKQDKEMNGVGRIPTGGYSTAPLPPSSRK